jgi:hypothetical protein
MKLMASWILCFACATLPAVGLACSDPVVPSFSENLQGAKNIFVFRLVSLELVDHKSPSSELRGNIKVVRMLKGDVPTASTVVYVANACCSIKLTVGRYYMAALDDDHSILRLVPGDQSILDVSDDFSVVQGAGAHGTIGLIQGFLSGNPLPAGFPGNYRLESTITCPTIPTGT